MLEALLETRRGLPDPGAARRILGVPLAVPVRDAGCGVRCLNCLLPGVKVSAAFDDFRADA